MNVQTVRHSYSNSRYRGPQLGHFFLWAIAAISCQVSTGPLQETPNSLGDLRALLWGGNGPGNGGPWSWARNRSELAHHRYAVGDTPALKQQISLTLHVGVVLWGFLGKDDISPHFWDFCVAECIGQLFIGWISEGVLCETFPSCLFCWLLQSQVFNSTLHESKSIVLAFRMRSNDVWLSTSMHFGVVRADTPLGINGHSWSLTEVKGCHIKIAFVTLQTFIVAGLTHIFGSSFCCHSFWQILPVKPSSNIKRHPKASVSSTQRGFDWRSTE